MDGWITDGKAARRSRCHGGFNRQRYQITSRQTNALVIFHGGLHGKGGCAGLADRLNQIALAGGRRCGEPTSNGIAAKADDAAAVAFHLADEGGIDHVQVARQFIGPTSRSVTAHQRRRERGKAGNIGEEGRAGRRFRQARTGRQGAPPVASDVGSSRLHSCIIRGLGQSFKCF